MNAGKQLLPCGATVPSLGLSNKAVYSNELELTAKSKTVSWGQDDDEELYFAPQELSGNILLCEY